MPGPSQVLSSLWGSRSGIGSTRSMRAKGKPHWTWAATTVILFWCWSCGCPRLSCRTKGQRFWARSGQSALLPGRAALTQVSDIVTRRAVRHVPRGRTCLDRVCTGPPKGVRLETPEDTGRASRPRISTCNPAISHAMPPGQPQCNMEAVRACRDCSMVQGCTRSGRLNGTT